MPARSTHTIAGIIAGGLGIAVLNQNNRNSTLISDYVGSVLGGFVGSRLPDIIDPPVSPNHRSIGHGFVQCVYSSKIIICELEAFRSLCFSKASELEIESKKKACIIFQALYSMASLALKLIAGFAVGVLAGFISHIALDALSTKSIPIFA